jgi:Xaa-Pro dipeptidase
MTFESKLREVQELLIKQETDGWLLYDYKCSNPLAYTFLEIAPIKPLTRRFFYWIPKKGNPIKILPMIEPYTLDHLPGNKMLYQGWQELERLLQLIAVGGSRIAMEYSPYNALPAISKVDAGTIELLRQSGAEIVSSANLLQSYTSVWSSIQLETHLEAAEALDKIVNETWSFIEKSLVDKTPINEYQVQTFMLNGMHDKGFVTEDLPTCSVNENTSNPHYSPPEFNSASIQPGDFILIDLWCKKKSPGSVYADITRVAVAASQPTAQQKEIFNIVKDARDAATHFIKENYAKGNHIQGWQADQVARDVITKAGYGDYFIHRTGHNIGEEVHGAGANLDNLETHDYRELLAGTCCSIEPGIYLPKEFGIRLEYDIFLGAKGECTVTGGIQTEITCMNL